MKRALWLALALLPALGCPGPADPNGKTNVKTPVQADALGPMPELGPVTPYKSPAPQVFQTREGITVWLLERHQLPLVALSVVLPSGGADDPPGKAGLAHITASMLDEGAGARDAIAISSDLQDLGASIATDVSIDGSRITLASLERNLPQAFGIVADVIARPRFDANEWKRVHTLWVNQLEKRADDPQSVASVVSRAVLYGPDTPYGHPASGNVDTAETIGLEEARAFYAQRWRPDQAMLVVAGDIDRAALEQLIDGALADWKRPAGPPPGRLAPPEPLGSRPRLVLVDRPDAPQSVVMVVRPGVAASSPEAPLLDLVNTALGGSFTSRLNQSLREDRGWTYGARSSFSETRGVGPFVASAAVFTNVTAAAARQMLIEIEKVRSEGLTADELLKVRARDLTDLIETHETLEGLVSRLGSLAILGLPPDFDARASALRQAASPAQLGSLAGTHLDTSHATVVVVGPSLEVETQLKALGLDKPERWTPEGRPAL